MGCCSSVEKEESTKASKRPVSAAPPILAKVEVPPLEQAVPKPIEPKKETLGVKDVVSGVFSRENG